MPFRDTEVRSPTNAASQWLEYEESFHKVFGIQ